MTQEKQTSIRILQSKPVKKTLGKSSVFLLGLLTGIIVSAIFFFIFINLNQSETVTDTTEAAATAQEADIPTHTEEAATNPHDESAGVYKQHINDKDFNQIFKHENKPAPQPSTKGSSPFEQMLKPEAKPASAIASKPPAVPAKPVVPAVKPKVEPKAAEKEHPAKKEEAPEISPEATVKMTIERKETENKP
ncbi:hypothetical protein [Acinetobacter sp.]|jgi:hypothetical protein|uniref:hypothetical protein n=1 Tax=Acinetobacter sp. TaxID=472 RepID=UPI00333F6FD8